MKKLQIKFLLSIFLICCFYFFGFEIFIDSNSKVKIEGVSRLKPKLVIFKLREGLINQKMKVIDAIYGASLWNSILILPKVSMTRDNFEEKWFADKTRPFSEIFDEEYLINNLSNALNIKIKFDYYGLTENDCVSHITENDRCLPFEKFDQKYGNRDILQLCDFFLIFKPKSERERKLKLFITEHIKFNKSIEEASEKIISKLPKYYNGFHYRIEKDFDSPYSFLRHDSEKLIREGFSEGNISIPTYVATGLFFTKDIAFKNQSLHFLQKIFPNYFFKENFLSKEYLSSFTIEQQAAIEYLVLLKSNYFVGDGFSSFSYLIHYIRSHKNQPSKILLGAISYFYDCFPID